jgi:beta-xylosidase
MLLSQVKNNSGWLETKSQTAAGSVWVPDNGDGTYRIPILFADYSDPDAIRVGDDYNMTSSSFSHSPGLPILHSKDLVNWDLIGHAVRRYPLQAFNSPPHGNGIWAPSLRFHNGEYYIYFGDPDNGIFMTKAKNPKGPWQPLRLVREAKGWIDPCPFWDDDGNAFLGIDKSATGYRVMQSVCLNADKGMPEKEIAAKDIAAGSGYLRVEVASGALCSFSYSLDGISYLPIGEKFAAKAGRWVGTKVGLFAVGP